MMKGLLYLCLALLLAFLLSACSGDADRASVPPSLPSDSLYSPRAALAVYDRDPARALLIIDSALILGNISDDNATLLKAKVFTQSTVVKNLDSARLMLEGLMASDYVDSPNNREEVLDLLVIVARLRNDNLSLIRWATEKSDFCRQQGLVTEALRTEADIAVALYEMGETNKALAKLDGIIATLDKQRLFNEMDACIIALKRKIVLLNDLEQWNEVIPLANIILQKINDYSLHHLDYNDGSYRLPSSEENVLKYCDFYSTEAYAFIASAFAELGRLDSARHYLALFKKSDFSRTATVKLMVAAVYRSLGDYASLLSIYDEAAADMNNDTVNNTYASMLHSHILAAEAWGNTHVANHYLHRYIALYRQLVKNQMESRAYNYAARYHLQEQQLKTEKEVQRAELNKRISIVIALFALTVLALCVRLLVQRHNINLKNKALVNEISQVMKYKELVDMMNASKRASLSDDKLTASRNKPISISSDKSDNQPPSLDEMSDDELFAFLSEVIRKEKLFTNPSFGRQSLVDRFNLSDRRIGAAFAHGSKTASHDSDDDSDANAPYSLTVFTRQVRLEYACQLLSKWPDMSISEISAAAGFSSPIVFNRAFKAKYEITPSFYRSQRP